jgi:hypothetical protein
MESVTSSLCRAASTADTTEDDLRQLENALQPLKEDLINSSITYAKHMESLANFSVEIRRGLSKTLSNQAVLEQVAGRVLMTFPSVIRVMSLAYLWLADSLGKDDILSRTQSSTLYPHVTGRSLVCVNNSSCVVHTMRTNCSRLTDSERGCLIVAKAHKKIDVSMKFLTRTLYCIVHGIDGEEWFDSQLANGRVFNTKKTEARKLILNHAHVNLSDQDRLSLAAFNAAEAAGLRAKDAARALQVQTAGGNAGAASGGRDAGGTDDEGTSPDYSGLEAMPSNPAAPAPAQAEASQQGAGGPPEQGAGPAPGPGQAGRRQRGRADWAAAHEPREAPTERLADLAEWVKKLATAVSSAFSALSRTGKLQQVPRACARGGMGTVCDGL